MLYDPAAHEPPTRRPWDEGRVAAAVAAIVEDAEGAFDGDALWPPHPLDEVTDADRLETLYLGAAGVVWALDRLGAGGWADVAAALPQRYADAYDEPLPSFLIGESGVLVVAHGLAPDDAVAGRLLEVVRANARNPARELLWGSPGTMVVARAMWERTGDDVWRDAWRESADWVWSEWRDEVWRQEMPGWSGHVLGPAHGFAGNVVALAQGGLLDGARRDELERRVVAKMTRHAVREDGVAQWPPSLEEADRPEKWRTQWCHGAPGIVTSLAWLAPRDDDWTELLTAGGELTWRAGPHAKGAGLCHGTAGNGYAFLALFERTREERWLERARSFAMHAVEQVERTRGEYGRGRYSLFTGDVGTALYLQACIDVDARFPVIDVL